jgi:6-phosphofructokinase 1
MSNCLVAQSGGPTCVINASLSGVIEAAINSNDINTVYGSLYGIQGILNNNIVNLSKTFCNDENLNTLKNTPSMFLGSCRYKLPEVENSNSDYIQIFNLFNELDIKYFFYIGGNDSMDTVLKLSSYAKDNNIDVKIMGVPKTIDNDLFGTDHTPGYGSAAKFVGTTMLEIAHDAYSYDIESITIVEIMGRNAGWLTAAAALARNSYNKTPDLIYLPEVAFNKDSFIQDIANLKKHKKNIIIAVSEGVKDKDGNYISAMNNKLDSFGHPKLSGTGKQLEHIVKQAFNCKVRSIELNVLQRCASHTASLTDINEATLVGRKAVEYALEGLTSKMIVIHRESNSPYSSKIECIDIHNVANKEKDIPRNWINEEGNDITIDLLNYIKPLTVGEPNISYKDGIPNFISIEKVFNK